jgi:hypothetical protein
MVMDNGWSRHRSWIQDASKSEQRLQRARSTRRERHVKTESDEESSMHQTMTKVANAVMSTLIISFLSPPIQNI